MQPVSAARARSRTDRRRSAWRPVDGQPDDPRTMLPADSDATGRIEAEDAVPVAERLEAPMGEIEPERRDERTTSRRRRALRPGRNDAVTSRSEPEECLPSPCGC